MAGKVELYSPYCFQRGIVASHHVDTNVHTIAEMKILAGCLTKQQIPNSIMTS
jgi:hypothetical protein